MTSTRGVGVGLVDLRTPSPELVDRESATSVFTVRERREARAGRGLESWAGRLAAKHAVARAVGRAPDVGPATIRAIEILPDRSNCSAGGRCASPHRPIVARAPGAATRGEVVPIGVSISHLRSIAVAVAIRRDGTDVPRLGVDVIERERTVRWQGLHADALRCRGLSQHPEIALVLKESAIKTLGRRPSGTGWSDIALRPAPAGSVRPCLVSVADALATAVEGSIGGFAVCTPHERCATDRARVGQQVGAWVHNRDYVFGIVMELSW
jgi:phosphopantetheinyl transferase (holo-ACP synthase)